MKIYTKTGDTGTTALYGGKRVPKYDLQITCYGTTDELHAHIGLLHSLLPDESDRLLMLEIQNDLFNIGSHLAADADKADLRLPLLEAAHYLRLESEIDKIDATLAPMTAFILPSGSVLASHTHIARTVCRRAERLCVEYHEVHPIKAEILIYLNRLSDYLFILSRKVMQDAGVEEIKWISNKQ